MPRQHEWFEFCAKCAPSGGTMASGTGKQIRSFQVSFYIRFVNILDLNRWNREWGDQTGGGSGFSNRSGETWPISWSSKTLFRFHWPSFVTRTDAWRLELQTSKPVGPGQPLHRHTGRPGRTRWLHSSGSFLSLSLLIFSLDEMKV